MHPPPRARRGRAPTQPPSIRRQCRRRHSRRISHRSVPLHNFLCDEVVQLDPDEDWHERAVLQEDPDLLDGVGVEQRHRRDDHDHARQGHIHGRRCTCEHPHVAVPAPIRRNTGHARVGAVVGARGSARWASSHRAASKRRTRWSWRRHRDSRQGSVPGLLHRGLFPLEKHEEGGRIPRLRDLPNAARNFRVRDPPAGFWPWKIA